MAFSVGMVSGDWGWCARAETVPKYRCSELVRPLVPQFNKHSSTIRGHFSLQLSAHGVVSWRYQLPCIKARGCSVLLLLASLALGPLRRSMWWCEAPPDDEVCTWHNITGASWWTSGLL
jgi:hypothetical protein